MFSLSDMARFGRVSRSLTFTVFLALALKSGKAKDFGTDEEFETRVAPILISRCIECHQGSEPSGGLDLSNAEGLTRGGDSGPVLSTVAAESSLLQRIHAGEMPPPKNGKSQKLRNQDAETLSSWISKGSPWPQGRRLDLYERTSENRGGRDWWSFQPISSPEDLPIDRTESSTASWIDKQIEAVQTKANLVSAPRANPRELLRRLFVDLTGLPPRFELVQSFEKDNSQAAYLAIVDQLLDSDAFAERWTQHWLDVVRFAETNGYERDAPKPRAWRYRDWVLHAIRDDMPFDQFLTEQIAGDQIPNRTESSVIATGFLRLGSWDDEPNDPVEYQYERLEDMVHVTSTAFLGLTVKCARCHDHKFDPIPQLDYYRVAACFWNGPIEARNREWNGGPTKEELGFDVLGWTEIKSAKGPLHLLLKGNPQRPAQPTPPGQLTAFRINFDSNGEGNGEGNGRLKLALWMLHSDNPLTARVAVNRFWTKLFGDGLVRTTDNFGFTGAKPTHPKLLDGLAIFLRENGWSVKRLIKSMVLSSTYQQASVHPMQQEFERLDAGNQTWWHANRRRLDAESLRDSILHVSEKLQHRLGGESFYAPIESQVLEGLSMKSNAYHASLPELTFRRSLYMFKKRSLAVPMMTVFDCCDSTVPVGKRDSTIVAPQALTMLNGALVKEQANSFAEIVLAKSDSLESAIELAWKQALIRNPTEIERASARELLTTIGASDYRQGMPVLCHALLNTNEFIFVD